MNDPLDPLTPDEDLLAVSALLDGTATPEDAARVAADDALGELLTTLRRQRESLAHVSVPPGGREDALTAALAVFDELHGYDMTARSDPDAQPLPEPSAPPTNVLRFERRRASYRLLSGAAAAVGVLFVGALLIGNLGSIGGDDDESSSFANEAAAKTAPADAFALDDPATPMVESAEAGAADGEVGGGAFDTRASRIFEETSDLEAATEATEAPAATSAPAGPVISADSIDAPADVQIAINNPQQLLDYANTQQPVLPLPGLDLPCVAEGFEAIGEVIYRGTSAVVVRDPATRSVSAVDLTDACAVIVTVED